MKAILKKPGKGFETTEVEDSLKALQDVVGGYIEVFRLDNNLLVICNEEGKIRGFEYNCTLNGEDFVGNILLVGNDGENFTDCPATAEYFNNLTIDRTVKKESRRSDNLKKHDQSTITKETRQESYIRRPMRAEEILGILGDEEMTARQILARSKYTDMNAIRPRITELKEAGEIEAVGKAYDLATNRNVAVFRRREKCIK